MELPLVDHGWERDQQKPHLYRSFLKVSRNCIKTFPRGKTARATRAISSGTDGIGRDLRDMGDLLFGELQIISVPHPMLTDEVQPPLTSPPVSYCVILRRWEKTDKNGLLLRSSFCFCVAYSRQRGRVLQDHFQQRATQLYFWMAWLIAENLLSYLFQ